jgi:uncharacterized protein with NRDE domain
MCLILFSAAYHAGYPVIIAANRDESYDRPSTPLAFWPHAPHIAGGRDLQAGGTWLALARSGRWAALTNYRQPGSRRSDAPSRGMLVADYLLGSIAPEAYLRQVQARAHEYNGFNLLVGDTTAVHYLSNREGEVRQVPAGVHGLSNHLLNTPWPKVALGKLYLEQLPLGSADAIVDALLERLRDTEPATDAELPDTGIGRDRERLLSPPFIAAEHYGTRASTVIVIDAAGAVTMVERRFGPFAAPLGTSRLQFTLEHATLSRTIA